MQYMKIPLERIPILIGEHGRVKKRIEDKTNTKIEIEGTSVTVEGEPMGEWIAKDTVLAIGRGFNPEIAFGLFDENNTLEVINLKDIANSENEITRLKGRIIGEGGRGRKTIEEITGTSISVYGKSIGIIGAYDDVATAKEAIGMLVGGARHASVYKFLERSRSRFRGI